MINTSEKKEKYIEIAVTDGYDMDAVKSSLDELARLLDTAGAESVYQLTQTMEIGRASCRERV